MLLDLLLDPVELNIGGELQRGSSYASDIERRCKITYLVIWVDVQLKLCDM